MALINCVVKILYSLVPIAEISRLQPFSVAVQPVLCQTWLETPKAGLLVTRLRYVPHCEKTGLRGFPFPTRSDTNQTAQLQKIARGLKFWI